ncbi:hypothetical protein ACEPAI_7611 [Sanghuangporus weigelae]
MHPVANNLYCHLDAYTMLQSLPGLCIPLSLLLGTAVLAKATVLVSTIPENTSSCSCKRRRHEDSNSNFEDESAIRSRKKARLAESSFLDEVDLFLCDTTLVDKEHDDGAERISKPVTGSLVIPSSITPSKSGNSRPNVKVDSESLHERRLGRSVNSRSVTLSSYRHAKHKDEFSYDPSDVRHEWELRWFICAHHAAFTAATAMSLRREIRRRKTLSRMWRDIRKENIALKEDVKKLTFELHGFVEV